MVIENETFFEWVKKAVETIEGELVANYSHILYANDNSPVIVHHKTAQCTVVISGSGYAEIAGLEYSIHTGSIILANAGDSHKFWTNDEPLRLFHIHIPYETMNDDRSIISGDDFIRHYEKG